VIHVALASTYGTEAEARTAIADDLHVVALGQFRGCHYLGVWTMPPPFGSRVHLFSDRPTQLFETAGWTREAEA
jgi:hypothetical protein